ncbi:hypothetical protein F0562_004791 [Nyssa sinensis]|uniref:Exocyst subunit Exo70 family protein n=1 Tax=Nyssa sinensis TaxID=561372 RepID=A0A5J5AJW6_9ASTE|nr:hypothetical protein F0562_004791 [Nyssa sinensis]
MTSTETEKGKHLPEESPSVSPTNGGDDIKNDNENNQHEHNHNQEEQEEKRNHDSENVPPPEPPAEVEAKTDDTETENKEEEISEINIPPDLSIVTEEIEQFILALSSAKKDDSEPPEIPQSMDQFAVLVEAKVANYDSDEKSKYASSINRIGGILQRAMSYLEDEFRSLLEEIFSDHNNDSKAKQSSSSSTNQETDHSESPDSNSTGEGKFPGYSEEVVSNLNKLAKAMISGGYETECFQVYIVVRRRAFEENLHKLGFAMVSIDDVQKMQWESLERDIVSWIKTFKECTTVYFSSERVLSETVFSDYQSTSKSLFGSPLTSRDD